MQIASWHFSKRVADTVNSMTDGMETLERKTVLGTAICFLLDGFNLKDRDEIVSGILSAVEQKQDRLMSKKEVLEFLGIKPTAFDSLIRKGEFPQPLKIGKRSMWTKNDLSIYINRAERRRNGARYD